MEPHGQHGEGVVVQEDVVAEILTQPDAPVTILVYSRVENNTIKEIKRMWWYDDNALANYTKRLMELGFLYDDSHLALSRRNKVGYTPSRESYQFIQQEMYEYVKNLNGLSFVVSM